MMQISSCTAAGGIFRAASQTSASKCTTSAMVVGQRRLTIRTSYIDVEAETSTPNAPPNAPGRWGSSPPPPPPPPPPQARGGMQAPNRRELMFAALGSLVGGLGVAAFYNTQYDLSAESGEKALDELLDDPEFLNTIADEALYQQFGENLEGFGDNAEQLAAIDKELSALKDELERAVDE